jgi:SpoVK/Ycf46/Vps4 family AAA+-type ATPase
VTIRLAAGDQDALDQAERLLRERLPEPEKDATNQVTVEFFHWDQRHGPTWTNRTLAVPNLAEIAGNYSGTVRRELERLTTSFAPDSEGRLLLWHGQPGCGKTWALRALASEWRDWCTLRYVTDPEVLLNEPAYLMHLLHMRPSGQATEGAWRLIVLEDTGELLSADAKQRTGQGLSRLLNVVDGLLGESSKSLFLITTNEDLRTIHPAIARPGRCARLLEFHSLSAEEANAWLEAHGCEARVAVPATVAELFALHEGRDMTAARRQPVGFS